ncbi:MAG: ABC transporter permease [Clostridiales bacterium]|nr:ABC transporter permease [Clostridiales bacterium]
MSLMLNIEDIAPATEDQKKSRVKMRESTTYWQDALKRFSQNKVAMVSFGIIVLIAIFAFLGPLAAPYTYEQQIRGSERLFPCFAHPFGTDNLGRDILVRTMTGTRISLAIGIFCTLIVLVIGTLVGSAAGYLGGWLDNMIMRFCEILYSVPDILIIIILQISMKRFLDSAFPNMTLGSAMVSIFIAFAMLYWVNMARMVRGQILILKQSEYVLAAKALGASGRRIIQKHLLPNAVGAIIVTAMYQIPVAIFTESFLSFMGLGASAPLASLGSLANDSLSGLASYPYLMFFPAMLILLIIYAFNQFGDGLRDALDPRLKE